MDKQNFYVNSFGSRISNNDFLLFGAMTEQGKPLTNGEEADILVFMSPQAMKQLYVQLQQSVSTYEKLYGAINFEPNVEALNELRQATPDKVKVHKAE